jgi:hypothetical protein
MKRRSETFLADVLPLRGSGSSVGQGNADWRWAITLEYLPFCPPAYDSMRVPAEWGIYVVASTLNGLHVFAELGGHEKRGEQRSHLYHHGYLVCWRVSSHHRPPAYCPSQECGVVASDTH